MWMTALITTPRILIPWETRALWEKPLTTLRAWLTTQSATSIREVGLSLKNLPIPLAGRASLQVSMRDLQLPMLVEILRIETSWIRVSTDLVERHQSQSTWILLKTFPSLIATLIPFSAPSYRRESRNIMRARKLKMSILSLKILWLEFKITPKMLARVFSRLSTP